jgi:hypothetical protein
LFRDVGNAIVRVCHVRGDELSRPSLGRS